MCDLANNERNYLGEARAILRDDTMRITERAHLEALDEHYQSEIIRIVHEIEQVTTATLKRN